MEMRVANQAGVTGAEEAERLVQACGGTTTTTTTTYQAFLRCCWIRIVFVTTCRTNSECVM